MRIVQRASPKGPEGLKMIDLFSSRALVIALTFFLAYRQGCDSDGLPTVAMGVLGSHHAARHGGFASDHPSFVTNFWQLFTGPNFTVLISRLWPMMLGIVIGTVELMAPDERQHRMDNRRARCRVAYAGYSLLGPPLSVSVQMEHWLSSVVGMITGGSRSNRRFHHSRCSLSSGACSEQRRPDPGAWTIVHGLDNCACGGLAIGGAFHLGDIALSSLAIVPALLGMWFGQLIRQRISAATFRRWFLICLFLLGLELAIRPFI